MNRKRYLLIPLGYVVFVLGLIAADHVLGLGIALIVVAFVFLIVGGNVIAKKLRDDRLEAQKAEREELADAIVRGQLITRGSEMTKEEREKFLLQLVKEFEREGD